MISPKPGFVSTMWSHIPHAFLLSCLLAPGGCVGEASLNPEGPPALESDREGALLSPAVRDSDSEGEWLPESSPGSQSSAARGRISAQHISLEWNSAGGIQSGWREGLPFGLHADLGEPWRLFCPPQERHIHFMPNPSQFRSMELPFPLLLFRASFPPAGPLHLSPSSFSSSPSRPVSKNEINHSSPL